jgi:hypothetical protein
MSNLSIVNNDMDVNVLNSLYPKYPGQISLITAITVPQVLPNDASYVFCSSGAGVINLVLPSAAPAGKNLFIVNRTGTPTVSSQSAAGTNLAAVIDIEVDPNVLPAVPQVGILPAVASSWVHLVSNGTYWVAVSKSNLLPAV